MDATGEETRFIGAYGLAHFGKSLFWHASEVLFAFFLTETCALTPRHMAVVLSSSLIINAAADLAVGWYLSRRVETTADAGRAQFIAAWFSVCAFCTFGCSGLVAPPARFAFAMASIVIFRLSYPFLDIPQNTLLTLTTSNDAGRARLSSARFIFGGLANIALAISFGPLLQGRPAATQAINFACLCFASGTLALAGSAALRLNLKRRPNPIVGASRRAADALQTRFAPGWRIWLLFAMILVSAVSGSVFVKLLPYLSSYATFPVEAGGTGVFISVAIGSVISQPLWAWMAERLSLLSTLRISACVLSITSVFFCFALTQGETPAAVAGALSSAGAAGVNMCLWALIAGAVGTKRWLAGAASAFGLATALAKLGSAAAAYVVAELLTFSDYHDALVWKERLLFITASVLIGSGLLCVVSSYFVALAPRLPPRSTHSPTLAPHR